LAGNESQWPAQYPRDNWQADPEGPATADGGQPTAAQVPPGTPDVPPTTPYAPPATPYAPPATPYAPPATPYAPAANPYAPPGSAYIPPAGYQVPPGGYPIPPAGYQVPPGGYHVPPGYPIPAAAYQVQARMSSTMRAAAADRERAVDVLKAGFTEGRLTQDEYNDRMGRAYAARTYGELTALTADLPAGAMPAVWPVQMYQPPVTTNSLARASLVLGVAEFFTMGLTAIPAIICGHMAKREMRQTGQRGDGLATSGLVLGYMAVIFWGILIALSIVGAVIQASGGGYGG
jgi:Domain of unknown function (DUF1707)/Domain of unknown function (DUF4190)